MTTSEMKAQASTWIRRFARIGLVAKGIVYTIAGMLALLAALHIGRSSGNEADRTGVLHFIYEQPLGKVMLGVIAVGLLCYSVWRLVEGIKDTENKGSDLKGIVTRGVYIFSGLLYLSVAFYAGKLVLTSNKKQGNSQEQLARELLSKPFGQVLMYIGAGIMIIGGAVQCHRALSGKYKKKVRGAGFSHSRTEHLLIKTGMAGYLARGIVWFIIGWLFIKAAWHASPNAAGDSSSVFQWLQSWEYGQLLMGVVAAGLVCYGVFMFVRARYQPIHT